MTITIGLHLLSLETTSICRSQRYFRRHLFFSTFLFFISSFFYHFLSLTTTSRSEVKSKMGSKSQIIIQSNEDSNQKLNRTKNTFIHEPPPPPPSLDLKWKLKLFHQQANHRSAQPSRNVQLLVLTHFSSRYKLSTYSHKLPWMITPSQKFQVAY